jgi:23S rRNA (uracil1939-C5)-methyltransferase
VRITSKKAKFWEGELVELIKPSPLRRKPPCPVADRCGGCSWQHVTYAGQVEEKKKILAASLRPVAKLGEFEWLPFVEAPSEFNYRNRIQVQIRAGQKGFFAKRSHDLVATSECLIAEDSVNAKLKNLAPEAGVSRVELRSDGGSDFAQVNDVQNAKLKELVLERAQAAPEWIMDLYCGSGNITFPLAEKFPGVSLLAVDLSATAIAAGRAKSHKSAHLEWIADDVENALAKADKRQGRGLIVLDPPRTGCAPGVITQLLRLAPKQILYVSCNPTTFARDCLKLLAAGYRLETVQGLDMFPQTEHVELVASLCAAT